MITGEAAGRIPRRGLFAVLSPLVVSAGVAELPVGALLGDPPVVEDHDVVDLVQPLSLIHI